MTELKSGVTVECSASLITEGEFEVEHLCTCDADFNYNGSCMSATCGSTSHGRCDAPWVRGGGLQAYFSPIDVICGIIHWWERGGY